MHENTSFLLLLQCSKLSFFLVVAARAWDSFLCGKTGISSLITSCTRNTGGRKIHCHSGRQQYVLFTPDTCFLVFLQIDTDSRVSVSWWGGRSFKTSRIGSKPWGPECVYCSGLLQNSTHSRVSHPLPILVWIAQSLRDEFTSTVFPHLQVFNQCMLRFFL